MRQENRRIEPRFPVTSPIRVIIPGTPARVIKGNLLDVSATGMKFVTDENLPTEEILGIEVDHRLILAEIRHCEPRGDRFASGVRRLHEIDKSAELSDSASCVTEMVRDLHRHIAAPDERDPAHLAMKALEKIVENDGVVPA